MWPIFKGIIVIKFAVEEFLFSIAPVCFSKWLFPAIYKSIWLSTVFFIIFDFQMKHWILFRLLFRLLPFDFGVLSDDAQMEMCNSSLQLFNFNFQWQYFNFCSISFIRFRTFFFPSRANVWSMSFLCFANGMVFFFFSWFHKNKLKILNDNIKNISYPWSLGIVRNHIWVVHYIIHIDDLLQVQNMRT